MASREMIDVLQRLRELDETNPNVHTDALENTEKMNPPVEEAKKKMVKDPKTGKMVPDYAIDGKGKDDLKKENVKEADEKASPEQRLKALGDLYQNAIDTIKRTENIMYMTPPGGNRDYYEMEVDQMRKHAEKIKKDYQALEAGMKGADNIRAQASESIDTDSALDAIMKKDLGDEGIGYVFDKFASRMSDEDADELAKKLGEFYPEWYEQHYQNEGIEESITISADSPEDLPVLQQIMKLAGMQPVSTDMMPDADNVPMMKPDDNVNGSPCSDDNPVVTKRDGVDFDLDRDGMPDITYDNSPDEQYKGVEDVTTQTGYGGTNGPKHPQDLRVKDPTPYGDFKQRLAKLAGIENEEVEDEETDEGYANSMGNEKEDPTYKGYDPDYSDHTEDGKPKVRYVPSRYADNPLESIENNLKAEYEKFKK